MVSLAKNGYKGGVKIGLGKYDTFLKSTNQTGVFYGQIVC